MTSASAARIAVPGEEFGQSFDPDLIGVENIGSDLRRL